MTRRQLVLAAGAILLAMVAFFPLRMAVSLGDLAARGITAQSVEGSIWAGSIRQLRAGPVPVGDVQARLHFWPLLLGRTELSLSRDASASDAALSAVIAVSGDGFTLSDADAGLAVAGAFAPLPVTNIRLNGVTVAFSDNVCTAASGTVEVDVEPNLLGLTLKRGLSGKLACRGDALFLPLKGQSGLENLDLSIRADGSYTSNFILRGFGGELAVPLGLLGFQPIGDDGYQLQGQGRF